MQGKESKEAMSEHTPMGKSPYFRMRFYTTFALLVLLLLAFAGVLTNSHAASPKLAFPGAVGFGSNATGGGSNAVYYVTTLNDSGSGSFRDAVSKGNRVVDFKVSGYIDLSSVVSVSSNLTINGQTAPGSGVGVMGREVSFSGASNIIVQDFRFRQGTLDTEKSKSSVNLLNASNLIFDHVSIEFGQWNDIDSVGASNITIQDSIIADPIGQQFGAHTQTGPYTWYHDVFANSHNRNPLAKDNTQFINNVVYDYQAGYTAGNSSGHFSDDILGNYFIAGPATTNTGDTYYQMGNQSVYSSGNYLDSSKDGSLNGQSLAVGGGATTLSAPWSSTTKSIPTSSAASAYSYVVANAGALPRDQVDSQVISNVTSLGHKGSLWTTQTATGLGNDGYGNA
jgi:hypothetical protein